MKNYDNHENHRIPINNYEIHENLNPHLNYQISERHRIQFENYEIHENVRIPTYKHATYKIINAHVEF